MNNDNTTENDDNTAKLLTNIIDLVDTMITPFDVVDVMDELVRSCLDLVPASSAGILLSDMRGGLQVLASSTHDMEKLELLELQHEEGPCFESFRLGTITQVVDLPATADDWPNFTPAAIAQGITAVYAIPMTLRARTLGALNLFCTGHRSLADEHLQVTQVLASMATIAVLNHRTYREQEILTEQLQTALSSRVLIEQAKGILAEREGLGMDRAFELLRRTARSGRRMLSDVAADVVSGQWPIGDEAPSREDQAPARPPLGATPQGASRGRLGGAAREPGNPKPPSARAGPK